MLRLGGQRFEENKAKAQEQHEMEWEQTKVVQRYGTVHTKKEVKHKPELYQHIRRKLVGDVLVALPSVAKAVDIEFWGSDEFTPLAQMTLQYGN